MYCHVCFVVIDISHHTVLDLVSNMDGVLKHVPSINPDDMHPTPFKPNPSSNPDDIPPTPLKPVPSINPDNMPPTSCWQQIRKNLVSYSLQQIRSVCNNYSYYCCPLCYSINTL